MFQDTEAKRFAVVVESVYEPYPIIFGYMLNNPASITEGGMVTLYDSRRMLSEQAKDIHQYALKGPRKTEVVGVRVPAVIVAFSELMLATGGAQEAWETARGEE